MAQTYRDVSLDFTFGSLEREPKLYAVSISPALRVQTPVLTVVNDTVAEPGAALALKGAHQAPDGLFKFFKDVESRVLDACIENKAAWFPKGETLDADTLRSSFKTFVVDDCLKTRFQDDCVVYDQNRHPLEDPADLSAGTQVRCVLELSKISFGKHEFGVMWRVAQMLLLPGCLIDEADVVESGDEDFL